MTLNSLTLKLTSTRSMPIYDGDLCDFLAELASWARFRGEPLRIVLAFEAAYSEADAIIREADDLACDAARAEERVEELEAEVAALKEKAPA